MNLPENIYRPSWVEIDLDSIVHNLQQVKAYLPGVKVLAVVKADAYGLGAVPVSRLLVEEGVDYLGVVALDEAIQLRQAGIQARILNMGNILPQQAATVVEFQLEQMVYQQEVAEALSRAAQNRNTTAKLHLKIDTGMSRYGVPWREAVASFAPMAQLPQVQWLGAMTHFPLSDALDKSFALLQIHRFKTIRRQMEDEGFNLHLWHMCNSGGVLDLPEAHLDMVRVGLMLYGYFPSTDVRRPFILKPAMTVKTHIAALRTIDRGDTVGYGRRYLAEKRERIAVLPIGYADGYDRKLRGAGQVLIQGKRAAIISGLCMDACFINVSEFAAINIGEPVIVMGQDGEEEISPHDIAGLIGSVSYEVMARFGKRLPRLYRRNGEIILVENHLVRGTK